MKLGPQQVLAVLCSAFIVILVCLWFRGEQRPVSSPDAQSLNARATTDIASADNPPTSEGSTQNFSPELAFHEQNAPGNGGALNQSEKPTAPFQQSAGVLPGSTVIPSADLPVPGGSAPARNPSLTPNLPSEANAPREIVGIGAVLRRPDNANGAIQITSIMPFSPAALAGLSAGWMIRKVDGLDVSELRLQECVQLIRGPIGTKVQLELVNEQNEIISVEVTREKIKL